MHWEGDPNGCSENCTGPHFGDNAPEVCPECGGNGRICIDGCIDRVQRYEPWEGSTGAAEAYEYGN